LPILSKKPKAQQPLQLDRDFAGRQIIGSRDEQQDSYAFSIVEGDETAAHKLLVIVADGMGGHVGGREASLAAVSGFVDAFFEALDAPDNATDPHEGGTPAVASEESAPTAHRQPTRADAAVPGGVPHASWESGHDARAPGLISPYPEEASSPSPGQASAPPWVVKENAHCPDGATSPLRSALLAANLALDQMIAADPDNLAEAGTTLVAAVIERGSVRWISVGDSPLLLWRKGQLSRLNTDHSMRSVFAAKIASGQMRASDVATHPERNALLSALNGLDIQEIDDPPDAVPLLSGDLVIAASDGLLTLTAIEISKALKKIHKEPAISIVRTLLELVEKKALPKQDNTSIAIVRV